MKRSLMRAVTLFFVLAGVAACWTDSVSSPNVRTPAVVHSAVAENPHNVLSAAVIARVRDADSVRVRFGRVGKALTSVTPARVTHGDSVVLPVLGLPAETEYALQVVGYGSGTEIAGEHLTFSTGSLPDDLPRYIVSGADPSPGYVVFAAGNYGLVIDNTGRVVWYRRFANAPGLNFQAQPTGRYVTRPPSQPGEVGPWLELDALGNVTRAFACLRGLQPRFHDLLMQPDGSYWIMCDETRTMDLSQVGGFAAARVTGTVVQHISEAGTLLFEWSPFDHFEITDLAFPERAGALVNWTHGNALALTADGNLLVSFRSLNEITKIDTRTGRVMWRLGGLRNEFTFQDNPPPPFARQHGLRVTAARELLVLDNSGDPHESRAERYTYDEEARSARMSASYGSKPAVIALLGGTVQHMPSGHTLVSFGNGERVEEYDTFGNVVWRIENPGYVFRAQRILSLYEPGAGLPR